MADLIAPVKMLRWDTGTLSWMPWDGSLSTGLLTIGTVDQGAGGASPWRVKPDAFAAPTTQTTVNIGTGGATVIAANASRKSLLIVNLSTVVAYLKFGSSPAVTDLRLGQYGFWSTVGEPAIYTGALTAITASGTATLNVVEG